MNKMTWDEYFINIAKAIALKSHCLSIQRGCIIVEKESHKIISTGYNGPPKGFPHCDNKQYRAWFAEKFGGVFIEEILKEEKICPRKIMGFSSGQGYEYCSATHAEQNAILQACNRGLDLNNTILYCSFEALPCRECAKAIINTGIQEVVLNGYHPLVEVGLAGSGILEACGVWVRNGLCK